MAVSDAVVGNLTTIYVAVIAAIKAYGLVSGRSFGGGLVLVLSTAVVGLILVATLTWDVSQKAAHAIARDDDRAHEVSCKGGICWHGVAVKSPASQVRFHLPPQQPPQPPHHGAAAL
ncbi:uncharacterized protein LOC104456657 [Eucalyptus grandis]|uniref:Uncharacterized protein n=3 Tax=Eucalyptus TaxID=3932 RepID=A0A059AXW2_EUCGR|nr:uncharacterized protein LOC104456657 [Eucalyptus grandis]KAK3423775.1 hypothetical protein EUGRSUZ_H00971 [Eucalyptus grandis]